MAKILIIEDDPKTANAIRSGLRGEGYDTAVARTGEFELLAYLLRYHGQTVTRQMLAKDVWREPHRATPLDNVIDVHVAHLRRKIDEGHRVKLIQTVRGVGFVLREDSPA